MITPYTTTMNHDQGLFILSAKTYSYIFGSEETYDTNEFRLDNQRLLFLQEGNNWEKTNINITE